MCAAVNRSERPFAGCIEMQKQCSRRELYTGIETPPSFTPHTPSHLIGLGERRNRSPQCHVLLPLFVALLFNPAAGEVYYELSLRPTHVGDVLDRVRVDHCLWQQRRVLPDDLVFLDKVHL